MKKIILLSFIFISFSLPGFLFSADTREDQLPDIITALSTDKIRFLDDPAGIPESVNITVSDFFESFGIEYDGSEKGNVTVVNSATYNVTDTDYILHVTYTATGATTITLLTALCDGVEDNGKKIVIKDTGNASTNNITIVTEGVELIDGAINLTVSGDYDAPSIYCYSLNWWIH